MSMQNTDTANWYCCGACGAYFRPGDVHTCPAWYLPTNTAPTHAPDTITLPRADIEGVLEALKSLLDVQSHDPDEGEGNIHRLCVTDDEITKADAAIERLEAALQEKR